MHNKTACIRKNIVAIIILASVLGVLLLNGCGGKSSNDDEATRIAQDKATMEALATNIAQERDTNQSQKSNEITPFLTPTAVQDKKASANNSLATPSLQELRGELPGVWMGQSESKSNCGYIIIFEDLTFREQIDEDYGEVVVADNSIIFKYEFGDELKVVEVSSNNMVLQDNNGINFHLTKLAPIAKSNDSLQQSLIGLWVSKKGTWVSKGGAIEDDITEIVEYTQENKVYHVYYSSSEGEGAGGELLEFTPILRTAVQEYNEYNSFVSVIDQIKDNSLSFRIPYSCDSDSVVNFTKIAGISNLPEAIIGSWEIRGYYDYDLGSSIEFTREGVGKSNVYGEFPYSVISSNTITTTIDEQDVFWNVVDLTDSTLSLSFFGLSYLPSDVQPTEYSRR